MPACDIYDPGQNIDSILTGCTVVVKTASAAVGATGTVYAVAAFPVKGGVWVGLDDSTDNSGTDTFQHGFVRAIGPQIIVLNGGAGLAYATDIYIEVATDGDPVWLFYK